MNIYGLKHNDECPRCGELKYCEENHGSGKQVSMCKYCGFKVVKSYKRGDDGKILSKRYASKLSNSDAVFKLNKNGVNIELNERIMTVERFNALCSLMKRVSLRDLVDFFPNVYDILSACMNDKGELPPLTTMLRMKTQDGEVLIRDDAGENTFIPYVHEGDDNYIIDALSWNIDISGGYGVVTTLDVYGREETHVFAQGQNIEEMRELALDDNVVFLTCMVDGRIQTLKYPGSVYANKEN